MLIKIGDLLSKLKQNLPELAFLLFVSKVAILGLTSIGDALAIISLVGYIGYSHWLNKSKIEDKQMLLDQMSELKLQMQNMSKSMQENFLLRSEAEQLRTDVASLKMQKALTRGAQDEQKAAPKRYF